MNDIYDNIKHTKQYTGVLAVISLVLGLLTILFVIISISRVKKVQHLPTCLIAETPGYRLVHNLCTILPTGSLVAGIVAIIRMFRDRSKIWSLIFASGGVAISLVLLVVYWISLVFLASGHVN